MGPTQEKLKAAALTDVGNVRTHNEDSYGLSIDDGVFVVCDGMGGAAGGEIASKIAVSAVKEVLCAGAPNDPERLLRAAVASANERVFSRSEQDQSLHGMGTTLVALLVHSGRAWLAHVGDSRCYRFRGGVLERLTEDHSFVDEQVRLGQMTPAEAAVSPFRNIITRAVGTRDAVEPDITGLAIEPGDMYLLCSDGLTKEVPDGRLAEILGGDGNPERLCGQLVDEAKASGGHDNITVIVVGVG